MRFFDQYDEFYSTSRIGSHPNRLNSRYEAIIAPNIDLIRGRTVLDLASHNGRWTFAALMAGARHVIGVEARAHLVEAARRTLNRYGISDSRYRFVVGDACEVLKTESIRVETVLLLGFFYHTYRHFELASLAAATGATHIVLDTAVARAPDPEKAFIEYCLEPTGPDGAPSSARPMELVGRPSRRAVELMFGQLGFELTNPGRSVKVDDPQRVEDYRDGKREIFVLKRTNAIPDASRDVDSLASRET